MTEQFYSVYVEPGILLVIAACLYAAIAEWAMSRAEVVVQGVCHICRRRADISYCEECRHWFCRDCRKRWFRRGIAAVMHLVQVSSGRLRHLDVPCCGPEAEEELEEP